LDEWSVHYLLKSIRFDSGFNIETKLLLSKSLKTVANGLGNLRGGLS